MDILTVQKKQYEMASSWEELRIDQKLALTPLVFCTHKSPKVQLACLRIIVPKNAISDRQFKKIKGAQFYDLFLTIDWLWNTEPVISLTEFQHLGVTYLVPKPDFSTITLGEFAIVDVYYRRFVRPKPSEKALDLLVATLCRPAGDPASWQDARWNGDQRQLFNSNTTEIAGYGPVASLPIAYKVMVLQLVSQALRNIQRAYRIIFEKPGPESDPPGVPLPESMPSYVALIFDLAEQGIFGDFEKTSYTPIHTVLTYLRKKKLDAKNDPDE